MKALVYKGAEQIFLSEVPFPEIRKNEVLMRNLYAGICGSDLFIVSGRHPRVKDGLILGHEFCGVIEESGGEVKNFKKRDRIVCYPLISCGSCLPCKTGREHVCENLGLFGIDKNGGMAQFSVLPANNLFKLPNELSDQLSALIEPLATAVHAIKMSQFKVGNTIVILGGGPIGTLIALVLQESGAKKVFITEINEFRLHLLKSMGLKVIHINKEKLEDIILNYTNGNGADIVFESSGNGLSIEHITEIVSISGQIVIVGLHKELRKIDLLSTVFKELTIQGTRVYTKQDFATSIDMAVRLQNKLHKIITQTIELENAESVFTNYPVSAMKILIKC